MATYKLPSVTGQRGEKIASQYLIEKGYRILETNFYPDRGRRTGEIDIVAQKNAKIVFVEVKTRTIRAGRPAFPEEQVTRSKLSKLHKTAQYYLQQKKVENDHYGFHVITVCYNPESRKVEIRHLEDVFF